jgi:hypothetical protein
MAKLRQWPVRPEISNEIGSPAAPAAIFAAIRRTGGRE